jgi:hypothetical protein
MLKSIYSTDFFCLSLPLSGEGVIFSIGFELFIKHVEVVGLRRTCTQTRIFKKYMHSVTTRKKALLALAQLIKKFFACYETHNFHHSVHKCQLEALCYIS